MIQKILIIIGIILLIIGIFWPLIKKLGLGKLPGDIIIQKGNFTFYFPVSTCILISLIIMLIFWFFNK
ncbi:DUF2905 domain-containing protein [Fluoribacter gormanii]|uniref:Protein of uncharacterized function (DUF2905) n=1 Tax=Fluoribacter gormanii TaxID=464 RepID=A0A377GJY3_9GAMM|nr:DUF2905 domain-containing protein [Fluoribacter gormanii]KTD04266.1 hypothetical protein Lgor_1034 [Fluoribacter gormanii]MCW8443368.1 DUF2905 domain-containing protein [Fluoribacter gormanii]MCW8471796.1 DUF2905 domain-containing protein [Fluoribacter gormanii]SIR74843.1 Protein of unknown function [Fluoribacter gormanii]STO25091.1 Protein of uncharacterised function (DUF2905) [Fluoribacter gormanii]